VIEIVVARTALAIRFQAVASAGPFLVVALAIDYRRLGILECSSQ